MTELTHNQILYIENDLKSKGLNGHQLKDEVLDHVCCIVESKLNEGQLFSEAYAQSLDSFEDQGFKSLKMQLDRTKGLRPLWKSRLLITSIAACVFLLVVVVDARDRPDIRPLDEKYDISSLFGKRVEPILHVEKFHTGIDIKAPSGTPVKATASGVVTIAEESKGYGKYIVLKHDESYETMYAHLSALKVRVGDRVVKGHEIGLSGNTGRSTAPHLHYEVRKDGKHVDPLNYFQPK